ncbi:MAG: hypothetical protein JO273_24290 [Methylobacteriaceae bacterium]|nr:hypothetical protein [Methylobacteriaceae bacterium]
MMHLPGWNSADSTARFHNFFEFWGIVLFLIVVLFEFLAYFYGHRRDWLVNEAVRQASIQRQQADDPAKLQRESDATQIARLEEELWQTSKQVAADHSVKTRLRNLLETIDPQIIRAIDAGQTDLVVRMQPSDIVALRSLIQDPEGASLVTIVGLGRRFLNSLINNGSLGPSTPVAEQQEVQLHISTNLKE